MQSVENISTAPPDANLLRSANESNELERGSNEPNGAGHQVLDRDVAAGETLAHAGPLRIRHGIAAGAAVDIDGDLIVEGLVEGADIRVKGNFTALGGIAARDKGMFRIDGALRAKFIDSASCEVAETMTVEREAINCRFVIHGIIDAPLGSVIGGFTSVTGVARIGTLGSPSAVPTVLNLGEVPLLATSLTQLDAYMKELTARLDSAKEELSRLEMAGKRLNAGEKERKTEVSCGLRAMEVLLGRGIATQCDFRDRIRSTRRVSLLVTHMIHPSAIIVSDGCALRVRSRIDGPVHLSHDAKGILVYRAPGEEGCVPLSRVAEIVTVPQHRKAART